MSLTPHDADPDDPAVRDRPPPVPTGPPFFWRCAVCGRREPFGMAELAAFAGGRWPVCCEQTVLGYPAAHDPGRRNRDEGGDR